MVADSIMDDGTLAGDACVGDVHETWTPEHGFQKHPIRWVGKPTMQPCVRITLADGSVMRCSVSTPFTDPFASTDERSWIAPEMIGKRAFNELRMAVDVVDVEDIGEHLVIQIDFGGRSFAAGDNGLVWSHNMAKMPPNVED